MAHIETVHTGLRVITHVRGRVYRNWEKKARQTDRRLKAQVPQRRVVCLLDAAAGYALEQYQVHQPCYGDRCTHQHLTRDRVQQLAAAGDVRWIGNGNVAVWRETKHLVVRKSGGVATVQLREIGC